jgi:hypothetical protein
LSDLLRFFEVGDLGAELLPFTRLGVLEACIPALCIAAVSLIENDSPFAHMM